MPIQPHTLEINSVSVHYAGQDEPALDHVALTFDKGRIYAIIGPNGAGKSTLIKAILGLTPTQGGSVIYNGQPINLHKSKIAYVPQRSAVDWNFPISVREVVELGCTPDLKKGDFFTPKRHKLIAYEALEKLGIADLAGRQISKLSGGQQQRMFIARALAQSMIPGGAEIFLMDEPFTGIDAHTEKTLVTLMKSLSAEGKTIVAVHHNLANVIDIFSDVVFLNRHIIAHGSTPQAFNDDNIRKTFLPASLLNSNTDS